MTEAKAGFFLASALQDFDDKRVTTGQMRQKGQSLRTTLRGLLPGKLFNGQRHSNLVNPKSTFLSSALLGLSGWAESGQKAGPADARDATICAAATNNSVQCDLCCMPTVLLCQRLCYYSAPSLHNKLRRLQGFTPIRRPSKIYRQAARNGAIELQVRQPMYVQAYLLACESSTQLEIQSSGV